MSSTLKETALFVLMGVFLLGCLYVVSETFSPVYPEVKIRTALLQKRASEIEVVTIGNSHNRSIDFGEMKVKGFHLWRPGADIFEAKYVLEHTLPVLPSLKLVLMPIGYFFLAQDNSVVRFVDMTDQRRELYASPFAEGYLEGDFRNYVQGKLSPITRPDHWRDVFKVIAGKDPDSGLVEEDGWVNDRPIQRILSVDSLNNLARLVHEQHQRLQRDSEDNHPEIRRDVRKEIEAMATQLRRQNVKLVLYTPPYYHLYNELYDHESVLVMEHTGSTLALKHSNVWYFNYSDDARFVNEPSFFLDGDHLNANGRRMFSRVLEQQLVNSGLL